MIPGWLVGLLVLFLDGWLGYLLVHLLSGCFFCWLAGWLGGLLGGCLSRRLICWVVLEIQAQGVWPLVKLRTGLILMVQIVS